MSENIAVITDPSLIEESFLARTVEKETLFNNLRRRLFLSLVDKSLVKTFAIMLQPTVEFNGSILVARTKLFTETELTTVNDDVYETLIRKCAIELNSALSRFRPEIFALYDVAILKSTHKTNDPNDPILPVCDPATYAVEHVHGKYNIAVKIRYAMVLEENSWV